MQIPYDKYLTLKMSFKAGMLTVLKGCKAFSAIIFMHRLILITLNSQGKIVKSRFV